VNILHILYDVIGKKICITVFHSSLHDTDIPQGLQCISELNCLE